MNKKITISIMAALMIAGLTSIKSFAAMDNGSVVIGYNAFDLAYANDSVNIGKLTEAIVKGGNIYIKDFSGKWINNSNGLAVDASIIPAVTYTNDSGTTHFDAGDKDPVVDPAQKVTSISLNKTSDTLTVGGTDTLTSTISPSNAANKAVRWTSSNVDVATVNNGVVTAVSPGTAIITATTVDGSKTASCTITVNNEKGYVNNTDLENDLNVRTEADANSTSIGNLYIYQKIEILGTALAPDGKTWDKIEYNGKHAYVSDGFIQHYTSPSDDVVSIAENITKQFEVGNLSQIAGDADGQGLSLGYLQWNIRQGTLQPLLHRMDREYNSEMKSIFGTNYNSIYSMTLDTPANQLKWAVSINDSSNNIITTWNNSFATLCNNVDFKNIEDDAQVYTVKQAMRICDRYNLKTVRGFALAFDIVNQNGILEDNINAVKIIDDARVKAPNMTEKDLLLVIANAVADTATTGSDDTLSRKMAIVNGQGYVHYITLYLDTSYSLSDNSWR